MKKSDIRLTVELDDDNIPNRILWSADDKDDKSLDETKSISLSVWDHVNKNTLRIDLWTNEMPIEELKYFYIDTIGGLAQSLLSATGDEVMSNHMKALSDNLTRHVEEEAKKGGQ